MGGCASKPKEFDARAEPAPVEAPASPKKTEVLDEPVLEQEPAKEAEVGQKEDLSDETPEEVPVEKQEEAVEKVEEVEVVHEETVDSTKERPETTVEVQKLN